MQGDSPALADSAALGTSAALSGYRLLTFESLGSTNEEALRRAGGGDPGKLWIRAKAQTQGRGRRGQSWTSPAGNLYASLLLVDPAPMRHAPELGFVAGVALGGAIGRLTGGGVPVRLKWPNDLLWQNAKCAGILVEGTQMPNGQFAAVLGFGVNCLSHPTGLLYPTTCLSAFVPARPSADSMLAALSETMVDVLRLWERGTNFAGVREEWLTMALGAGSRLTVNLPAGRRDGTFRTIDALGRLILETDAGPLTVEAADVFLTAWVESPTV